MIEILGILKASLDLARSISAAAWQRFGSALVTPALTVVLMVGAVGAWSVARQGSIIAGIKVAFFGDTSSIDEHNRDVRTIVLQGELRQLAASQALIHQIMDDVLGRSVGAARVRLAVIHNGVSGLTGISLLKFDIVDATARPGRNPGELIVNESMAGWAKLLPFLLSGDCKQRLVSEMSYGTGKDRLTRLGVAAVLACPVIDIRNQMMGAIFVEWDSESEVPGADAMAELMSKTKAAGSQIALALDLRQR